MEFDQLDLQKALKILDALPQTIKELLSKHEIKKEELEPTLKKEPTPNKAPQTNPTPCKDLVVSTPKDNTYTTYHNNTNKVNLGKLSEREANLLFAIFQKLKDQGNTLIRFEPQDLRKMLGIKISYDNLTRTARSMWNKIKTADFWEVRDIIVNGRECVSEKNYMLFSRCKIELNKPSKYKATSPLVLRGKPLKPQ